ncbi:MAG: hypothetical protein ACI9L9_001838 [Marivirga sp.]|jgi:hypothetical protein
MELTAKIIDILPEQTGSSRNGEWRKQSFILETQEQYPKKVCADVWGDKIDTFSLQKGEDVTAKINVESREYNGKWYTDVKIWSVERGGNATPSSSPSSTSSQEGMGGGGSAPQEVPPPSADDELPF